MSYQGPEIAAIAAAQMSWKSLPSAQLFAAYMAASFYGGTHTPVIPENNIAYQTCRDLALIGPDGKMHELTFKGLELAIGDMLK